MVAETPETSDITAQECCIFLYSSFGICACDGTPGARWLTVYGCGTEVKSPGVPTSPHFTKRAKLVSGTIGIVRPCLSVHKIIAICNFRYLDSFELDTFDSDDVLLGLKLAVVHNVEQRLSFSSSTHET
jgi:hypothetical protein